MNEYTDRNVTCEGENTNNEPTTEGSKINLTIGVFFDGTLNNKYNVDYANKTGKVKENSSYDGTYSNVAELYECYNDELPNTKKIYVEGIGTAEPKEDGTSSGEGDFFRGYIWGTGNTGINGKIVHGCKLIAKEVKKPRVSSDGEAVTINTLTLDVFGFSRGAAAARSFVSQIEKICGTETEGRMVSLRQWLTTCDVPKIEVRFVGLFDTVSSFNPGWGYERFNDDVPELSLTIPKRKPKVEKVVHLVAADEYREYFALTTIDSAGGNGKQIILPGAHSDIGGGYPAIGSENILMNGHYKTRERQCRGYMSLEELLQEQWIPSNWYTETDTFMSNGSVSKYKDPNRYIKNDYAKIPLEMMGKYAKNEDISFSMKLDKRIQIPDNLTEIRARIISIMDDGALLYKIYTSRITFIGSEGDLAEIKNSRTEYLHLSARNDTGHNATSNNERKIIVDGKPPTEMIDSPIKQINKTNKTAMLKA